MTVRERRKAQANSERIFQDSHEVWEAGEVSFRMDEDHA